MNIVNGMSVALKVGADPVFGNHCGTVSRINFGLQTAFFTLTHKDDCTPLPSPVPLRRFPLTAFKRCNCR
ncbi:MAG: hypothetical protein V4757_11250 [Pseudomonadota bacterium]